MDRRRRGQRVSLAWLRLAQAPAQRPLRLRLPAPALLQPGARSLCRLPPGRQAPRRFVRVIRVMYVVNLAKARYVLHAFMKNSKSGIGLPKPDAKLIAQRLRRARELDTED